MHFQGTFFTVLAAVIARQALALPEPAASNSVQSSTHSTASTGPGSSKSTRAPASTIGSKSSSGSVSTSTSALSTSSVSGSTIGSSTGIAQTTASGNATATTSLTPAQLSSYSEFIKTATTIPIPTGSLLPGQVEFKIFSDSGCKNPVEAKWQMSDLSQGKILLDTNQNKWPDAATFADVTFTNTSSKDTAGAIIYWQVPDPKQGCRYVMMQDWPNNGNYGKLGVPQGYGMTVLNVNSAGCYYSSVPEGKGDFFLSTCCGSDCKNYAAGNSQLLTRRDAEESDDAPASSVEGSGPLEESVGGSIAGRASEKVQRDRIAARASSAPSATNQGPGGQPTSIVKATDTYDKEKFDVSKCKVVKKDGPWGTSGPQQMVGATQNCPASGNSCSFSAASGKSQAVTLSSSTTTTITNGVNVGFSIKVGTDFIVESTDFTSTFQYQFSKAVAEETSQSVAQTSTFTFTNQVSQYPGTTAFVSFIPSYECYTVTVNCGGGNSEPLDMCTTGENQGTYQIVTTSGGG